MGRVSLIVPFPCIGVAGKNCVLNGRMQNDGWVSVSYNKKGDCPCTNSKMVGR